jgi:hypothetical protein
VLYVIINGIRSFFMRGKKTYVAPRGLADTALTQEQTTELFQKK